MPVAQGDDLTGLRGQQIEGAGKLIAVGERLGGIAGGRDCGVSSVAFAAGAPAPEDDRGRC